MVAATQINGFLIVSFSLTGFSREESLLLFLLFSPFVSEANYLNSRRRGDKRAARKIPFSGDLL